jgi:hypothetical protein
MTNDEKKWLAWGFASLVVAAGAPVLIFQALGTLDSASDKRFAAVLTLVGITVTASASLIAASVRRQSERRLERHRRDEESRLRLDAAMRAGELFSPTANSALRMAYLGQGTPSLNALQSLAVQCGSTASLRAILIPTSRAVSEPS